MSLLRRLLAGVPLAAVLFLTGCFANTNQYHTAETLAPGEVAIGGAFYVTDVKAVCLEGETSDGQIVRECADFDNELVEALELVAVTPDVFVRAGLIENLEIGGRINYNGAAVDLKWRFLDTQYFDMAIDPALRLHFPLFGLLYEIGADLPLLMSVRIAEWFQIYTAAHGLIGYWDVPVIEEFDASVTAFGFSTNVGLSFEIGKFFLRPEFSYNNYLTGLSAGDDEVGSVELEYFNIGLGAGTRFGGSDSAGDAP